MRCDLTLAAMYALLRGMYPRSDRPSELFIAGTPPAWKVAVSATLLAGVVAQWWLRLLLAQ